MTSMLEIVRKYSETGHSDLFEIKEIKNKARFWARSFDKSDCTFLSTLIVNGVDSDFSQNNTFEDAVLEAKSFSALDLGSLAKSPCVVKITIGLSCVNSLGWRTWVAGLADVYKIEIDV